MNSAVHPSGSTVHPIAQRAPGADFPLLRCRIEILSGASDGTIFESQQCPVTIGSARSNSVCLPLDQSVAAVHARITQAADGFWIEDMSAAGGIVVNGSRNFAKSFLQSGDLLTVGHVECEFIHEPSPER